MVEYLGFVLSFTGLTMSKDKVQTIKEWPTPHKVKDVQSFLGFANFYHHFIPFYSDITVSLTCLCHKDTPWVWSNACQQTFDSLKTTFTTALVLTQYILALHSL